ncbi:MAG: vWA domain-containing protein [Planctomycetota bacterium]
MNLSKEISGVCDRRRGAMMAMIVILLPVLLSLAALAINLVYIELCSTQVQIATDASAHAASRALATTKSRSEALNAANAASAQNPVGDQVITFSNGDLELGVATRASVGDEYSFAPTGDATVANSVRMTAKSFMASSNGGFAPLFPFLGNSYRIRPQKTATVTQGVVDISLVIDRSGSMAYAANEIAAYPPAPAAAPADWEFGDPVPRDARWLDLVAATRVFLDELQSNGNEEQVSLTTYSDAATTPVQLTTQFDQITNQLDLISTSYASGATNITQGLVEGAAALTNPSLSRDHAQQVLVLMTDGVYNLGGSPKWKAGNIADQGVMLYLITFSNEADTALMQTIVRDHGAVHIHADSGAALREAFREVARRIPTLLTN